ncbi:MAG: hypothetical protein WBD20_12750 [Pirellulaceae bacterium]
MKNIYYHMGVGVLTLATMILPCGCGTKTQTNSAKESKAEDKFFVAVASGDPNELLGLFHADLREKVDAAVIESWMKVFNETHGSYEGLSWSDFKTGVNLGAAGKEQIAEGTFNFKRGSTKAKFTYLNDQLVGFDVTQPDAVWNQIFPGIEPEAYSDLNQRFLSALFSGDYDEVRADTFFADDDEILGSLKKLSQDCQQELGKLKSATLLHRQWLPTDKATDWRLTSIYRCEAEKGTQNMLVGMGLKGMKGLITSVSLSARKDFPIEDDEGSQEAIAAVEPLLTAIGASNSSAIETALAGLKSAGAIDGPVAIALAETMKADGGDFQSISDLKAIRRFNPQTQYRVVSSKLVFKSKSFDLDLYLNEQTKQSPSDQLVGIVCEQFKSVDWGKNLVLDSYQQRGEELLKAFQENSKTAWEMLHPNLQAAVSLKDIEAANDQAKELGALKTVAFKRHELGADGSGFLTIDLFYEVAYESDKEPRVAEVRFVFPETEGQILGFKRGF